MDSTGPIIVAHRGLHHRCAENSIGAFMAAAEASIPWLECDVWPSADDAIVLIHDQTLDRTTAGKGNVFDYTWPDLQKLGLRTLPELLECLPGCSAAIPPGILVEIKPPEDARFVRSVLSELSRCRFPWMVQSFHPENLIHALAVDPSTPVALLVETAAELYSAAESGWSNIHAHHSAIDPAIVGRMRKAHQKIGAWTVNAPADIQRMIDLGVDRIITDEPELAMRMCV